MGQDDAHRALPPLELRVSRNGRSGRPDARTDSVEHDPDMHEILVATDGSPAAAAALAEALALAAQTGDGIAVITVWRALQGDFGLAYPSTAVLADILEAERKHAETTLGNAVEKANAAGVAIVTRLATGDPAELICAHAAEIDARLIAIGTRGHGSIASLLLGSVSQSVVREAPCPVLVVRDSERTRDETHPPHLEVSR